MNGEKSFAYLWANLLRVKEMFLRVQNQKQPFQGALKI